MILLLLLAVPACGAVLVAFLPDRWARCAAVAVSAVVFGLSLGLLTGRHPARAVVDPWRSVDWPWIPSLGVRFQLGADGISWPLVALTALLVLLCAVYSLRHVPAPGRAPAMLALLLVLETGVLGTFLALDAVLFFVAFEVTLAPMFALIAIWGGPARRHAARKFLLYTLSGSVLLLVGILLVVVQSGTASIAALSARGGAGLSHSVELAAFALLLVAFAVKSPLWPLHTWLPDAHTEAPTVGSVLLAGVLLKMGTYGLIRLGLPVLPAGARAFPPVIGVLAGAAIIAGSLICLAQDDLKRLIAYSSVGHMGFVLLGIASLTAAGMQAALIGNIAHGILTGLLFFLAGALKDRYGTGSLARVSGLGAASPRLAGLLGFAAVGSLGLPGLAGFWGEAFAIAGSWQRGGLFTVLAVLAALGAVLTAAYFLRLLRLVVPGTAVVAVPGISVSEGLAWGPLSALALAVGLVPALVLALTSSPVDALVKAVTQ